MITFGVDVDDVVADLMTAWLKRYNKDYNDNLKKSKITDWAVHTFTKPECGMSMYDYIEDKTLYDEVKPIPNALAGVKLLKTMGRVIFITASTLGCAGRKYTWLQEHGFIDSMDDYVECKDKQLIKVDALIDDRYQNVMHSQSNCLFSQPWNKKYEYNMRIKNWKELINIIEQRKF